MAMPIITLPISPDATLAEAPRVRRSQFEEGVLYLKQDGQNPIPQSWTLNFSGLDKSGLQDLLAVLREAKGVYPISWRSPLDDLPRSWNIAEWTTNCLEGKIYEVSATFTEWFGERYLPPPGPGPDTHTGQVLITVTHNGGLFTDPNISNVIWNPLMSSGSMGFGSPANFLVQGPVTNVNWFYSKNVAPFVPAPDSPNRYTDLPFLAVGGYQLNVEWIANGVYQAHWGPMYNLSLSQSTGDGSAVISNVVPGAEFSFELL